MTPMPIIETPDTTSLRACGLEYVWEKGYFSIYADGVLISHQQLDKWNATVRMQCARDAHHNYLMQLEKSHVSSLPATAHQG